MGLVERRGEMKGEELAWRIQRERGDKYDVCVKWCVCVCV